MSSIRKISTLLVPRLSVLPCLLVACSAMLGQTAHYSGAQIPVAYLGTYATGMAIDKNGNLFGVDNQNGMVTALPGAGRPYTYTGLTVPTITNLSYPWGIAVDSQDNLYITLTGTQGSPAVIKETATVTPTGISYTPTTLTVNDYADASAIAVDAHGKIYLSSFDHIIALTPAGSGYTQSTLPLAAKVYATALAVDAAGNLYIATVSNNGVLKETPSTTGYVESTVVSNLGPDPQSIAVDGSGNVYIDCYTGGGDADDFVLYEESPTPGGYRQSVVPLITGSDPWSIAVDTNGNVFGGGSVGWEEFTPGAGVFNPVGAGANPYFNSSPEIISLIFTVDAPVNLGKPAVFSQGTPGLDFRDGGFGACTLLAGRHFQAGQSCDIEVVFYPQYAGGRLGSAVLEDTDGNALASGYAYGEGQAAQVAFLPATRSVVKSGLPSPSGVVEDAQGNLYFAGGASGVVYKGTRSGAGYALTTIATGLNHPTAVALDGVGNLFVAAANTVYQETPVGGRYVQSEPVSLAGQLTGIAVDGNGSLYVTSSISGDVHKETRQPDGTYVESGIGAGITGGGGVAVDGFGNVFVADPRHGQVYEEMLQLNGSYHQSVVASGLTEPEGIALDGSGAVYVTSATSGNLYKEVPQTNGAWAQSIFAADLRGPNGLGVDAQGNVFVSLNLAEEIDKFDLADPPILNFPKTAVGSTSSPQFLTFLNVGNEALTINDVNPYSAPVISSGFTFDSASTCPTVLRDDQSSTPDQLIPSATCTYAIDLTPAYATPARGQLAVYDSNLNAGQASAKQTFELREVGITSDLTHTAVRVSPNPVKLGLGVEVTVTVTDTSYVANMPQGGGVTFTDGVSGKTTLLNAGAAVPLINGKATLDFAPTAVGRHSLQAHYTGFDGSFASSTGSVLFTVSK